MKNSLKKWFAVILTIVMIVGTMSMPAWATGDDPVTPDKPTATKASIFNLLTNTYTRLLRYGMSGDDVRYVQSSLKTLGYLSATPDGVFGRATEASVKMFQAQNGLSNPDGMVGSWTFTKINDAVAANTRISNLRYGSSGAAVKAMQTRLKALGFLSATPDGVFGRASEAALKVFQGQNGIILPDGIAGPWSLQTLYHAYTSQVHTLRLGSRGNAVKAMQTKLKALGYLSATPDGVFGNMSKAAVSAFQVRCGLPNPDGIAGTWTLNRLYAYNAPSSTVSVTGITLSKTSLSLTAGDSSTLTATISPSNATNKSVSWTSSNANVAVVSPVGTVSAVGAGTAIISAIASSGLTATCSVQVTPKIPGTPALSVSCNRETDLVVFSWNATANTTEYRLMINSSAYGNPLPSSSTSKQLILSAGNYTAYLVANNSSNGVVVGSNSNSVSFTVKPSLYTIPDGKYRLINKATGRYLNGYTNACVQYPWQVVATSADGSQEQIFTFTKQSDNSYFIDMGYYNTTLTINGGIASGTKLITAARNNSNYQQFILTRKEGDYYSISPNSNESIAITETSNAAFNGHYFTALGDSSPSNNVQLWRLEKVEADDLATKINALRIKFPNGKYWNHVGGNNNPDGYTSTACTHHFSLGCNYNGSCGCNSFNLSIQCVGFARKIGYDLFGSDPVGTSSPWSAHTDFTRAKIGDYLYVNNSTFPGGHAMIIIEKTNTYIKVVEANISGTCMIRWDHTYTKEQVAGATYKTRP